MTFAKLQVTFFIKLSDIVNLYPFDSYQTLFHHHNYLYPYENKLNVLYRVNFENNKFVDSVSEFWIIFN